MGRIDTSLFRCIWSPSNHEIVFLFGLWNIVSCLHLYLFLPFIDNIIIMLQNSLLNVAKIRPFLSYSDAAIFVRALYKCSESATAIAFFSGCLLNLSFCQKMQPPESLKDIRNLIIQHLSWCCTGYQFKTPSWFKGFRRIRFYVSLMIDIQMFQDLTNNLLFGFPLIDLSREGVLFKFGKQTLLGLSTPGLKPTFFLQLVSTLLTSYFNSAFVAA